MKFIEIENLEVVNYHFSYKPGWFPITDAEAETLVCRIGSEPGTILTQQQFDILSARHLENEALVQKAIDEITPLIGKSILSLTDAERWKLVAAIAFKAGVIGSDGLINPYSEWLSD